MRLIDVYTRFDAPRVLYELLAERGAHANISHKRMPSEALHMEFYLSRPYECWFLIEVDGVYAGAVYLTLRNEIGVHVRDGFKRRGHGRAAVETMLTERHGEFFANIAPGNEASRLFFTRLGFHELQHTYVKEQL